MDADPEDVNCAQLTEYTVNGIPHMWICYDKSFFDYTLAVDTALQEHRRMNRVAAEVVASIDAKK
jgi:hypothetical protein